jgi:hypothetical protein
MIPVVGDEGSSSVCSKGPSQLAAPFVSTPPSELASPAVIERSCGEIDGHAAVTFLRVKIRSVSALCSRVPSVSAQHRR